MVRERTSYDLFDKEVTSQPARKLSSASTDSMGYKSADTGAARAAAEGGSAEATSGETREVGTVVKKPELTGESDTCECHVCEHFV